MGVLEFLVPFYPINTARVVFSSDLKMDPLNLYPTRKLKSSYHVDLMRTYVNFSAFYA